MKLELETLPAVLSIEQAIAAGEFLGRPRRIDRGDAAEVLARAEHVIEGCLQTGGQEHFYLETQAALAVPGENSSITVYSSTQNPSEIQSMVAHCLGLRQNQVVCIATRMGGAFGGKESQAAHPAVIAAALVAHKTGRPARLVYPRDLDMRSTGKRHPYLSRFRAGFAVRRHDRRVGPRALLRRRVCLRPFTGRDGSLNPACRQRLFHSSIRGDRDGLPNESAAEYRDARLRRSAGHRRDRKRGRRRSPLYLRIDPLLECAGELYGGEGRDVTPYGQIVSRNTLPAVIEQLAKSSDYATPRENRDDRTRTRDLSAGDLARAGQVRHLVHAAHTEPGQCAGQHLY